MLINLPNEIIGTALANELMSFFIVKDKDTGVKVMLAKMKTDLASGKINTKYYPITGNEGWVGIFSDERPEACRVPRDIIKKLISDEASNTELMDLGKAISQIYLFTSTAMSSSKTFDAPDLGTMIEETRKAKEKEGT